MQVQVNVEDENDNAPKFSESVYRVAIIENATQGATVVFVTATDPDEGSNSDIAFTLQGGDGLFVINRTSGKGRKTNEIALYISFI